MLLANTLLYVLSFQDGHDRVRMEQVSCFTVCKRNQWDKNRGKRLENTAVLHTLLIFFLHVFAIRIMNYVINKSHKLSDDIECARGLVHIV